MMCLIASMAFLVSESRSQKEAELSLGGIQCTSINECWVTDGGSLGAPVSNYDSKYDGDVSSITEDYESPNRYRAIVTAKITAYCLRGITRSGTYTTYGTAATDRRYIPQNSRFEIDGLSGIYTSLDTGSGVIGWHIDVWFDNCYDARQWGVRYKEVRIYE